MEMLWFQTPEKTIGKFCKLPFSPCQLESSSGLAEVTASWTLVGFSEQTLGSVLQKRQKVSTHAYLKTPFGKVDYWYPFSQFKNESFLSLKKVEELLVQFSSLCSNGNCRQYFSVYFCLLYIRPVFIFTSPK